MLDGLSCEICKFFENPRSKDVGSCLRFPAPSDRKIKVQADNWCGEFELDEIKQEKLIAKNAAELTE